jgi:ADP-ribose pyrophosphatase YjhB (NUDIX family)
MRMIKQMKNSELTLFRDSFEKLWKHVPDEWKKTEHYEFHQNNAASNFVYISKLCYDEYKLRSGIDVQDEWVLIKGAIENKENDQECVSREVSEETDNKVDLTKCFDIVMNSDNRPLLLTNFRTSVYVYALKKELKLDNNDNEFTKNPEMRYKKWFTWKEVFQNCRFYTKSLLEQLYQHISKESKQVN